MTRTGGALAKQGRIYSLDGLRGLAALVVLLHHSFLVFPTLAAPYYGETLTTPGTWQWLMVSTPLHLLWEGTAAVYVFFVLSGVVLAKPVYAHASSFNWRSFYPQRLARLYVPVWGAVIFAVMTFLLVPRTADMGSEWLQDRPNGLTAMAVAKDVTLLLGNGRIASPLWSLRWEILFSILLPIFMWVAFKLSRRPILAMAACVLLVGVGDSMDQDLVRYMPMFAIGVMLAPMLQTSVSRRGDGGSKHRLWAPTLALGLLMLNLRWLAPALQESTAGAACAIMLNTVGAAIIVLVAASYSPAKRFLTSPLLLWLGKISFSLYLIHEPIVIALAFLLGPGMEGVAVPMAIATSLLAGWMFFLAVEQPSHSLARRLGDAAKTKPPHAQAEATA